MTMARRLHHEVSVQKIYTVCTYVMELAAGDWGNTCQRAGIWVPATHRRAPPATAVHTGWAPISVTIAGGIWCPQCTEPLQSEIGTPSVINTVGE